MVRNKEKYEQAVSLRKRGFTLEEIAKYCEISKSTASKWLKDKAFSEIVSKQNKRRVAQENSKRLKLIAKARGTERKKRYQEIEKTAKVEFKNYSPHPDFVAGLMVYMMSGDIKGDNTVRVSSSDMDAERIFVRFALKYLGVEKTDIHLWLHLYKGASEERATKKWSKALSIPYSQFYKNQFVNSGNKKVLHNGVANVIIGSTYHQQKLKTWVKLAKKSW